MLKKEAELLFRADDVVDNDISAGGIFCGYINKKLKILESTLKMQWNLTQLLKEFLKV